MGFSTACSLSIAALQSSVAGGILIIQRRFWWARRAAAARLALALKVLVESTKALSAGLLTFAFAVDSFAILTQEASGTKLIAWKFELVLFLFVALHRNATFDKTS